MTIQSIISRTKVGVDGDRLVICHTCGEPICRSTINLGKVQCELCRRAENGEVLTNEAVQLYRASKAGIMGTINGTRIPPPEELEKEKSLNPIRSMGNGFIRALGFAKNQEHSQAKEVAEEKGRRRLFEERNLDQEVGEDPFGSMSEIDDVLEEGKNDHR